jgi:hypothetical protein
MGESPDGKLALSRQPLGEQTKHHTFARARIAADIESFRYQWL